MPCLASVSLLVEVGISLLLLLRVKLRRVVRWRYRLGAVFGGFEHRLHLLSIVLLFCTHGINLGRTEFCGEGSGKTCRVDLYASGRDLGNSLQQNTRSWLESCSPAQRAWAVTTADSVHADLWRRGLGCQRHCFGTVKMTMVAAVVAAALKAVPEALGSSFGYWIAGKGGYGCCSVVAVAAAEQA